MKCIGSLLPAAAALSFLFGTPVVAAQDDEIYTLYRNSPVDITMRIRIATFDADEGKVYNAKNCHIVAELFQKNAGDTRTYTYYWCEAGRYRK